MNIAIQFVYTKSLSYFYEKIDSTNYLYKHVSLVLKKNCIPLSMVSILLESKSPFLSATFKLFDVIGVALVVTISISAGYLNTRLEKYVDWGPWTTFIPFGLISVINVGISMLSTRFTGKLSNLGNYLGIVNTILSGAIDYILGNKAAIITYPITFIIYTFAIKKWNSSHEGIPNTMTPSRKYLVGTIITIVAFTISIVANYIGFNKNINFLSSLTTIVFAFSLIANLFNALKLDTQWTFWMIYNIVQLLKAFTQGNFANVGKYIFYIVNAIGAFLFWKEKKCI